MCEAPSGGVLLVLTTTAGCDVAWGFLLIELKYVANSLANPFELQATDEVPKTILVDPAEHLVKDAAMKLLVFEWFVLELSIFALAI